MLNAKMGSVKDANFDIRHLHQNRGSMAEKFFWRIQSGTYSCITDESMERIEAIQALKGAYSKVIFQLDDEAVNIIALSDKIRFKKYRTHDEALEDEGKLGEYAIDTAHFLLGIHGISNADFLATWDEKCKTIDDDVMKKLRENARALRDKKASGQPYILFVRKPLEKGSKEFVFTCQKMHAKK